MRVLLIGGNPKGSGGREHALAYLFQQSPAVEWFSCLGANAGIAAEGKYRVCHPEPTTIAEAVGFAKAWKIDLTIVGPEVPLANGIVDCFRAAGLSIFGPTKEAARLEASKSFAKRVMSTALVPTAPAAVFIKNEVRAVFQYLINQKLPVVIKADGLCAGKGAMICRDFFQVIDAVHHCFVANKFGKEGEVILVEEYLKPDSRLKRAELSILALVDIYGNFIMMLPAQDYKAVNDGDKGDNTGGVGAFAPVPWVTEAMMAEIGERIFAPTIFEMKKRGMPFSGCLYAGLMLTEWGFKVVEFNVRFGDPELQPLAMLLDTDIVPILKTIADGGSIAGIELKWKPGAAVCIVMTSRGYPGQYEKGFTISGLSSLPEDPALKVFHAGTRIVGGAKPYIVTDGGRVLSVTQYSPDGLIAAACDALGTARTHIRWRSEADKGSQPHFRTDIGVGVPTSI
ncbi:MAG: phosphoribosylamine--glycine ligase [Patescibacteria group bacterium]